MLVSQEIKYWMQRISVNLTNDCDGNHSISHSNIFFYVKLFATIILS